MYTIVLKKGSVELEVSTEDKSFIERQLEAVIYQASSCTNKHAVTKKPIADLKREASADYPNNNTTITAEEIKNSADLNNQKENLHVEPAQFHHITEEEKRAVIQNAEEIIPQSIDIGNVKPLTINSIQNPEPEPTPDFDNILVNEMNNNEPKPSPILKDERFIQFVESKSAIEKIDFLIITAQYLAQFEGLITFNLKHINAKLMQNFTLIVDHSVLQSAIVKEYVTLIQEGNDDSTSGYMLTEKGLRSY